MSKYALKLKVDATVEILEVPYEIDGAWCAKQIECQWIDIVRPRGSKYVLVVDDEGRLKEEVYVNPHASVIYGIKGHSIPIVGDCLMMKETMGTDGAYLIGITEEDAKETKAALDDLKDLVVKDILEILGV